MSSLYAQAGTGETDVKKIVLLGSHVGITKYPHLKAADLTMLSLRSHHYAGSPPTKRNVIFLQAASLSFK
jgi:hypothetical protein